MTNSIITEEDLLFFNGIDGATGDYSLPPMSTQNLTDFIRGEAKPENLEELRFRHNQGAHYGLVEGIDPKKLDECGWGIIFAHNADPAIKEALSGLINLRREQAGKYFKIYEKGDGYRPGENKSKFTARHGAAPGPVDPERMPYYLLIVGSPADIPFDFQFQLDVQYAVGRIHFNTPREYANYAASVVAAETGNVKLPRQVGFFGVANSDDKATNLSADHLISPLYNDLKAERTDWEMEAILKDQATKSRLAQLLGGDKTPALLITASHGMSFPKTDSRQVTHQGALLCQDWPGPKKWKGEIIRDFYFSGDDLNPDAGLLGTVGFYFACYGAGTPLNDEFSKQAFKKREAIAPYPFIAGLPSKMMSHPRGGALAVMGHVERAWGYSFAWPGVKPQTAVFESSIKRLLDGHSVGYAFEFFDERYAELATVLTSELEEIEYGKQPDAFELAGIWTSHNDARSYVILGDPAVKLAAAESLKDAVHRPVIQVNGTVEATEAQPTYGVEVFETQLAEQADESPIGDEPVTYGIMDIGKNVADSLKGVAQKLSDVLTGVVDDLTTLEVQTYTGDDLEKVSYDSKSRKFSGGVNLRAHTRIGLDGDMLNLIPERKTETQGGQAGTEIDQQLWQIHKEMVAVAQNSRLAFIKALSEVAGTLMNVFKK